jgi:DNA polymerase
MALHESVLEEFGLAPLWVRRGMSAAAEAPAEAPAGESTLEQDAVAGVARQADTAQMQRERDARSPGAPLPPLAGARERHDPAAPEYAGHADSSLYPQQGERHAPPAREDARAQRQEPADAGQLAKQGQQQSAQQVPPRSLQQSAPRSAQQLPQPSAQPSPPSSRAPDSRVFDAPPPDDFAWFDDQPAPAAEPARGESAAPPESASIEMLDWDALSAQVAGCERCRLCEKRTNTVFGVGDRNADWMLIGEAPGENEDRLGEPFVGQAGKLLDNMLRAVTLARDTNVYIANVIKCRPPGNRNPEPDEVARCAPYLQRQVALVKPKLIIALGRFAAQSLLRTEASISSLRGRVHEYEGVPVIVTYHPAYLLRSLPDKAKAWADLCLARDTWVAAGGVPSQAAK